MFKGGICGRLLLPGTSAMGKGRGHLGLGIWDKRSLHPPKPRERKSPGLCPSDLSPFVQIKLLDSPVSFMNTGFSQQDFPYKGNVSVE